MRRALLSCVILLGLPAGAQEPLPAPRLVRLAEAALAHDGPLHEDACADGLSGWIPPWLP